MLSALLKDVKASSFVCGLLENHGDPKDLCVAVKNHFNNSPLFRRAVDDLCSHDVQGCVSDAETVLINKKAGASAFEAGDYNAALVHYTSALAFVSECTLEGQLEASRLHANRALCLFKCTPPKGRAAHSEASLAVATDPSSFKARFRKAAALQLLGDARGAAADCEAALALLQQARTMPPATQPHASSASTSTHAAATRPPGREGLKQKQAASLNTHGLSEHQLTAAEKEIRRVLKWARAATANSSSLSGGENPIPQDMPAGVPTELGFRSLSPAQTPNLPPSPLPTHSVEATEAVEHGDANLVAKLGMSAPSVAALDNTQHPDAATAAAMHPVTAAHVAACTGGALATMAAPQEGRYLAASVQLPEGTDVLREAPAAWVPSKEARVKRDRCCVCAAPISTQRAVADDAGLPVSCKACPMAAYCGTACRDSDAFHVPGGPECGVPWPRVLQEEGVLAVRLAALCGSRGTKGRPPQGGREEQQAQGQRQRQQRGQQQQGEGEMFMGALEQEGADRSGSVGTHVPYKGSGQQYVDAGVHRDCLHPQLSTATGAQQAARAREALQHLELESHLEAVEPDQLLAWCVLACVAAASYNQSAATGKGVAPAHNTTNSHLTTVWGMGHQGRQRIWPPAVDEYQVLVWLAVVAVNGVAIKSPPPPLLTLGGEQLGTSSAQHSFHHHQHNDHTQGQGHDPGQGREQGQGQRTAVKEQQGVTPQDGTSRVGLAVYPAAALFNHSCHPNINLRFEGATLVARACRLLKPGAPASISYGPQVGESPTFVRRQQLASQYHFACSCDACASPSKQQAMSEARWNSLACPQARETGCQGAVVVLPQPQRRQRTSSDISMELMALCTFSNGSRDEADDSQQVAAPASPAGVILEGSSSGGVGGSTVCSTSGSNGLGRCDMCGAQFSWGQLDACMQGLRAAAGMCIEAAAAMRCMEQPLCGDDRCLQVGDACRQAAVLYRRATKLRQQYLHPANKLVGFTSHCAARAAVEAVEARLCATAPAEGRDSGFAGGVVDEGTSQLTPGGARGAEKRCPGLPAITLDLTFFAKEMYEISVACLQHHYPQGSIQVAFEQLELCHAHWVMQSVMRLMGLAKDGDGDANMEGAVAGGTPVAGNDWDGLESAARRVVWLHYG